MVNNLIVKYAGNNNKFKELLKDKIEYMQTNDLTPRVFLDIRGAFANIFDDKGMELCVKYDSVGFHAYSQKVIEIVDKWIDLFKSTMKIRPVIVLFAERGESEFHSEFSDDYKGYRKRYSTKKFGSELKSKSSAYISKELELLKWIFQTSGTNVYCHIADKMEIDYFPQLIIKNTDPHRYFNIILSNDKDLTQILHTSERNAVQVIKRRNVENYELITRENAFSTMLKINNDNIPIELFSLALAILGDGSDSVKGLFRIGAKTIEEFLGNYGQTILSFPQKDNLRRFKHFCKLVNSNELVVDKKANQVVSAYNADPENFVRSYNMVDFDCIIEHDLTNEINEKALEFYDFIVETYNPNTTEEYFMGKREFLVSQFREKFGLMNRWSYQSIIANTY
jgi:hypothetical protein